VLLNPVEKVLMNNPVRAAIQRLYEAPLLERLGGKVPGARVLEIGCGRGVGTEIILERFEAAHVDAFDLDPRMVVLARRRLERFDGRVSLEVADAAAIPAPTGTYDAVFDFGIVHHVPDWRQAIAEVARVLRPGGRFFFEEVTRHALRRWSARRFLGHPPFGDRFMGDEFVRALGYEGLRVADRWVERVFGDFVIGVAERVQPD
jgi:ubiquinone/menaquinone biosynthesis C-methylase UbiE